MDEKDEDLTCPLCSSLLVEDLYGPCFQCRAAMRKRATEQALWRATLNGLWPGRMDPSETDYN